MKTASYIAKLNPSEKKGEVSIIENSNGTHYILIPKYHTKWNGLDPKKPIKVLLEQDE